MKFKIALMVSASLAASLACGPLHAQVAPSITPGASAAPAPVSTPAVPSAIGEVVVTARRRDESLSKVPVTINAFSGATLTRSGVEAVDQLRQVAPGVAVSAQSRDQAQFYIRGQGPGILAQGLRNLSAVATYFAEVPTPISGPGVIYDLQNVQVLKGPQGTLFGRNTTGGAVLFEPARPTERFEGYLEGTFGDYNRREVEGVVNAPLPNDLGAFRLATQIQERDGFTKNVESGQLLDGRRYDSYRASLLLTPVSKVEDLMIFDYAHRNPSASGNVLRAVNPDAVITPNVFAGTAGSFLPPLPFYLGTGASRVPVVCLASPATPGCPAGGLGAILGRAYAGGGVGFTSNAVLNGALAQQQALGPRQVGFAGNLYNRTKDVGFTNQTVLSPLANLKIKNIVSYRETQEDTASDYDGTDLPLVAESNSDHGYRSGQKQVTEELQLQGSFFDSRLSYIAGYYHESSLPIRGDEGITSSSFGQVSTRFFYNDDRSNATFVHGEYNLTDALQLSGGFRYTWDKRKLSIDIFDPTTGKCTLIDPATVTASNPAGSTQCPIDYAATFKAPTYDGTLSWKPIRDVLLFAAYRHGFKSGGFNPQAPTLALASYQPETVDDYEIGLKGRWNVGVPLSINLSAYRDNYKNIQLSVPLAVSTGIGTFGVNAGRDTNQGVEFETTVIPVRNFTVSASTTYLDASADETVPGTSAIKGRQTAFQPKYTYTFNGRYDYPLPAGGDVALQTDYAYQAKVLSSDYTAPPPIDHYPGFGVLNARLEWNNVAGRSVDAAIFVTNLTDKTYYFGGYPLYSIIGFDSVIYGEPRMYGGSIKYHFGS